MVRAIRATSSTRSTGRSSTRRSTRCASSICRWVTRSSSRIATIRCARRSNARSTPGWSSSRRQGNLGKTEDGRPIVGAVISPGNSPAGADRRRVEHRGDGAAFGRRDRQLQLARTDGDRRRAETRRRGAGQQDRRRRGARFVSDADLSGADRRRPAAPTPTFN